MEVTETELKIIREEFRDLDLDDDGTKIFGEISFSAFYDGKKLQINPVDNAHPRMFTAYYEIEIKLHDLNGYGLPKVFELSGKILKKAHDLNIHPMDLHLNGDDLSCCLGIFTPQEVNNMTIHSFIIENITSFFAWQAYFSTFKEKPPWGEYPHDNVQQIRARKILIEMQSASRNDPCPCGSRKKFKYCCMEFFKKMKGVKIV